MKIENNDNENKFLEFKHFNHMGEPIFSHSSDEFGGTETMSRYFHNNFFEKLPKLKNYLCLILPGHVPNEILNYPNKIILWLHNTVDQFGPESQKTLQELRFNNKIEHIITVSEFHKETVSNSLQFPKEKISVVNNVLVPLNFNNEKFINFKKIKIVHTSDPSRGMLTLIKSLQYIDEDFDLEIYNIFDPDLDVDHKSDFFKLCNDKRITFFGKTPKKTVMRALEDSHIHAYPSNFIETFCLSQVEAMSGGLLCVYPKIGSLTEVSNNFGISYDYPNLNQDHALLFSKKLKEAIKIIKNGFHNPENQINLINEKYSHERVNSQWLEFHEKI
jgi:glycosyltransferase involved in cell wall biosynthesis